jgi:hypothetical protein
MRKSALGAALGNSAVLAFPGWDEGGRHQRSSLCKQREEMLMPTPAHEAYRDSVLRWFREHAEEPDVAVQLERRADPALVLWELDLGPARPVLGRCYAVNPRGGKPWDPLTILRCLLLALLVGQPSLTKWVLDLRASRVLRVLCGLPPDDGAPGVGTLYDFLHRLHDGPIRQSCDHLERPSEDERRRSRSARPKPGRPKDRRPSKAEKKARRKARDPVKAPVADESVTGRLVAELEACAGQPNPDDLLGRLATLLLDVGVVESARRSLLGDVRRLVVGGDGSALVTGGSRAGKRTCDHDKRERCDCARIYSDPDAAVGWDSHRECYFYGHHFYELGTSVSGHDLPLAVGLDPGNASDFTASLHAFDRLRKDLACREMAIGIFIGDSGHDGQHNYRFPLSHGAVPVIPLKGPAPAIHPERPDLHLSKRGVPTCQAGAEMAPWGSAGPDRRVFICPVKAGHLERCPIAPADAPDWLCRPEQKWGPSTTVSVPQNPRLCPPIPRNSPRHQELLNLRSGCERSNSVKKVVLKLEAAHHRRRSFWLIRLHLIALLQHARAWVASNDTQALIDHMLGRVPEARAA